MPVAERSDVLIALDGAAGRTGCGFMGVFSSGIRKATNKSRLNLSNGFIYFYLKSNYIQNIILEHSASRTTITHAGASIDDMMLPINKNLATLNNELNILYEKLLILIEENNKLNHLKQLYLKKFFD